MKTVDHCEFEKAMTVASVAHRRFMTAAALLKRRGLGAAEAGRVSSIHAEAFYVLTESLERIAEISEVLSDNQSKVDERRPAPRYSRDFRQQSDR